MMSTLASAVLASLVLAGAAVPAPTPAPAQMKAHEFLQRCMSEWEFCRVRLQAQMTQMNAAREACIPAEELRDRGPVRVAYVLEEVLEEDPDLLSVGDYKPYVGQIIALIWPCGVVS